MNAPYATPPAELDISDVRQRFYRGYCIHNAAVIAAPAANARAASADPRSAEPGARPGAARPSNAPASYLERFFADIATDADVGSKVLNRCVG